MGKTWSVLAAVLALGAGVAIGWLASTHFSTPTAGAPSGKPGLTVRIGDPALVEDAPR